MNYGKEIILRGGRYFDYKRKGLTFPVDIAGDRNFLWSFKTLGVYNPDDRSANEETGYVFIGWGNIQQIILSAPTEEAAAELLRIELTNDSEEYDGSHWDLEIVGVDLREVNDQPVLIIDNTGA